MRNRRFQRIFGSDTDGQIPVSEPVVPNNDYIRQVYQQWFDRDPGRFQQECDLLNESDIQFECRKLSDGRISFSIEIGAEKFVVVCTHNFPIEPVEVIRISGSSVPSIVDEDGKVDLFAHDGFEWTTETHIADVVKWVKTLLSIADSVKPAASDIPSRPNTASVRGKTRANKSSENLIEPKSSRHNH